MTKKITNIEAEQYLKGFKGSKIEPQVKLKGSDVKYRQNGKLCEAKYPHADWCQISNLPDGEYEIVPDIPQTFEYCDMEDANVCFINGVKFKVLGSAPHTKGWLKLGNIENTEVRFFSKYDLQFLNAEYKKETKVCHTIHKFSMHAGIPASEVNDQTRVIILHQFIGKNFDWTEPFEVEIKQLIRK